MAIVCHRKSKNPGRCVHLCLMQDSQRLRAKTRHNDVLGQYRLKTSSKTRLGDDTFFRPIKVRDATTVLGSLSTAARTAYIQSFLCLLPFTKFSLDRTQSMVKDSDVNTIYTGRLSCERLKQAKIVSSFGKYVSEWCQLQRCIRTHNIRYITQSDGSNDGATSSGLFRGIFG
jgi:hypothetical protein